LGDGHAGLERSLLIIERAIQRPRRDVEERRAAERGGHGRTGGGGRRPWVDDIFELRLDVGVVEQNAEAVEEPREKIQVDLEVRLETTQIAARGVPELPRNALGKLPREEIERLIADSRTDQGRG